MNLLPFALLRLTKCCLQSHHLVRFGFFKKKRIIFKFAPVDR